MDSESHSEPIDANEPPETARDTTPFAESVDPIEVAAEVKAGDGESVVGIDVDEAVEVARYEDSDGGGAEQKSMPLADYRLPPQFQNVAAKGGAIAALVLGCLSVFGAFVTQWSLFNAVVGLGLGLWGLRSNFVRTAIIGMVLCVIGLLLCGVVPAIR